MEGLVVALLLAVAVDITSRYLRDLREGLAQGGAVEAMRRLERQMAVADAAGLAVVADGEVTNAERDVLRRELERLNESLDPDAQIAALRVLAAKLSTEAGLRDELARRAPRLDADARQEVCAIVAALVASAGSRGRSADGSANYREVRLRDYDLLAVYADVLGVAPAR